VVGRGGESGRNVHDGLTLGRAPYHSSPEHAPIWWQAPYCSGVHVSKPLLAPLHVPSPRRPSTDAYPNASWLDVASDAGHQPLLARLGEQRTPHDVALRTEMLGRRRGVAVLVEGCVVGHLSRPFARRWHPWVLAAESVSHELTGTAYVVAGTRQDPAWRVSAFAVWPGSDVPPGC
jgi:hypothetical protein